MHKCIDIYSHVKFRMGNLLLLLSCQLFNRKWSFCVEESREGGKEKEEDK